MIRQMMAVKHNPPATYGDCYRACIASIIEVSTTDIPHPGINGEGEWFSQIKVMDRWLAERGLWTFGLKIFSKDLAMYQEHAVGYYILGGQSPRGCGHFVVARSDKIVHDPHPEGGGLVADPDDTWNMQWVLYGAHRPTLKQKEIQNEEVSEDSACHRRG